MLIWPFVLGMGLKLNDVIIFLGGMTSTGKVSPLPLNVHGETIHLAILGVNFIFPFSLQ